VAVVESASDDWFVKEDAMILAAFVAIIAIGLLCSLLLNLIIYALPLYVGTAAGLWAHAAGTGIAGSVIAGGMAAIAVLVLAQWLLAVVRSPVLVAGIGLLLALPAAFAGYHAVHGIVGLVMPPNTGSIVLSSMGAMAVGIMAWVRVPNTGRTS
jgi:hypothetical protein